MDSKGRTVYEHAVRLGVAFAIVGALLTACSSGNGDNSSTVSRTESSSDSPSVPTPPSPSPSDDIVAVAINKPRQPAEFPGDDDAFLREVHRKLQDAEATVQFDDETLVALGRQFCAILSGGGMLAAKVDYWGGSVRLTSGPDVPIFIAAWDNYCPGLSSGYLRIRGGSQTREPTAPQSADLVRFILTLQLPGAASYAAKLSTHELQRSGARVCETLAGPGRPDAQKIARVVGVVPQPDQIRFLLGLVAAFCPEQAEDLRAGARS